MSIRKPPKSAAAGRRPGPGRTVTVDYLTAAGHPDAVVTGILLVVIGLLVVVGLVGLLEPVLSLDLFRPDPTLGSLVAALGQIAASVAALVAAGLGLAKHPRFPAVFLGVAAALCLLAALALSQWLIGGGRLDLFPLAGLLAAAAVPYVVFSRRCRLIFRNRLDVNDLKGLAGDENWAAAMGPALPTPAVVAPRRQKPRTGRTPAATDDAGPLVAVPVAPPADPTGAALWSALYGTAAQSTRPADEPEGATDDAAGGSSAGRRVGLEALINLRPPES